MGDKYIIELEDKPFHKEDGDFLYRVKGFNSLVFDMTGIGKLTPYTEPDLERVKKEAYEKGHERGFVAGYLKAHEQKQDTEIKVGDEVTAEHGGSTFTVTWMSDVCICGIDSDGRCYSYEPGEVDGKTGNHHEIAAVL